MAHFDVSKVLGVTEDVPLRPKSAKDTPKIAKAKKLKSVGAAGAKRALTQ